MGKATYKGSVIYRDVADNLSKIKFPVTVTERYNPNIHYSLLGDSRVPPPQKVEAARGIVAEVKQLYKIPVTPIYTPGPNEIDAPCQSMLAGDYIIDALVKGQYISFNNPDDMEILADWIDQYIKSYDGLDLTRYPDRASFLIDCKKALGMLRGNILRKDDWEQTVNPRALTLAEILANL